MDPAGASKIPPPAPSRARLLAGAAAVAAAVAISHGSALRAGFVAFDDDAYVYQNPQVMAGLTPGSAAWAFGLERRGPYYHPLAWLSLMLDRTLFGPEPWGFHLTNVLLHAGTAILLLLFLARATGRLGPALLATLLFAVHPLTVEAVAWTAERKAVLAAFFGMAAILAYAAHAARPSWKRLSAVTALLAASLLSKPGLNVLPLLLLALDVWPLRRLRLDGAPEAGEPRFPRVTFRAAVLEKVPPALVSAALLAVSLAAAEELEYYGNVPPPPGAATGTGWLAPPAVRVANALASIPRYLAAAAWPSGLAVLHPYPASVPLATVIAGAAVVLAITAAAALAAPRRPWLLAGWLWFLVTLSPFLGLRQAGLWPGWGERFAYVPLVGLAMAAAFGAAEVAERLRPPRGAAFAAAAIPVAALAVACRIQVAHWRDSEALFRRAVAVEPLAAEMHHDLGATLLRQGRLPEGRAEIETAVRLSPWHASAQCALAALLLAEGRARDAEERYREALRWDPNDRGALFGLAELLRRTGRSDEARPFYLRHAAVRP